jgi:hypothetical protein
MAADALHITLVQRIIRKHRNLRHVSVDGARREVEFLAGRVHGSRERAADLTNGRTRLESVVQSLHRIQLGAATGEEMNKDKSKARELTDTGAQWLVDNVAALGGAQMKNEDGLTTPLVNLLYAAPECGVFLVQDAIRAVVRGDWKAAAKCISYAAEMGGSDAWFELSTRTADELEAMARRA